MLAPSFNMYLIPLSLWQRIFTHRRCRLASASPCLHSGSRSTLTKHSAAPRRDQVETHTHTQPLSRGHSGAHSSLGTNRTAVVALIDERVADKRKEAARSPSHAGLALATLAGESSSTRLACERTLSLNFLIFTSRISFSRRLFPPPPSRLSISKNKHFLPAFLSERGGSFSAMFTLCTRHRLCLQKQRLFPLFLSFTKRVSASVPILMETQKQNNIFC